ncbi:sensor histidine kinase [Cohnella boryungensis]|uniref:histidine kinase n=1 Tax=Cohnella boryungensis TaxID=768479 RepID=A0ABV8S6F0_9BACL
MQIFKVYLLNISILTTFAYLINLFGKFMLDRLSKTTKYGLSVLIFILAGWLAMFFSFDVGNDAKFDLRSVPLIFGLMVFSHPATLMIIGLSIGALRLTFGLDTAAWVGCYNLAMQGVLAALLCIWFNRRKEWSYWTRAFLSVLAINAANTINIAFFGVIPLGEYATKIMPITLPTSIVLSLFFLVMIRDFQHNQSRMDELSRANRLLRTRTQDLNAAKVELENKAVQLEAASRYKSEFLANMSHELKTPLNSIMLLSEMQIEQQLQEEDRIRYARLIHQSGGELLSLVNDILDLSKVEAGKLDVVLQPIALKDILQLMDEQFRPVAESKGLAYTTEIHAASVDWITTDPMRLNQILRNLLGNAFKFTAKGEVGLRVTTRTNHDEEEVVFQVWDTGAGIEADKQEAIFEVFKQADGSISRRYGGSGLGLAISKQLTEMLGGRLELESEKGWGSCFELRLPVVPRVAGS